MGISCSSSKQQSKSTQKAQSPQFKTKHKLSINHENAKEITIANGISYFLRRLDQFSSQEQLQKGQLISFFEKQQQWLEQKLECDIAFIIDLTTKNDRKKVRLLKELLADKERHQSRFGIIYLGHDKAQFDLFDDSHETSYNLRQHLQNLKLDDWINLFKALRAHIILHNEKNIPSIYILSEQEHTEHEESILEIVDNLLEDTCQKHSLNFHCHSYKVNDQDMYNSQDLSYIENEVN